MASWQLLSAAQLLSWQMVNMPVPNQSNTLINNKYNAQYKQVYEQVLYQPLTKLSTKLAYDKYTYYSALFST